MTRTTAVFIALLALPACSKKEGTAPAKDEGAGTQTPPAEPAKAEPAPAPEPAPAESPPADEKSIDLKDIGLSTPESILYDDAEDLYLVSNIEGSPTEADDKGFISRVGPDGKMRDLKWIDGSKPDVKLDAPKGMAFRGDILYVADIKVVRKFDRKTGAPKGEIAIKGATFLNDMLAAGDAVYVTDSGFTPDFKPSGSDAIHKIDGADKATPFLKDKKLGAPNGLAPAKEGLWVVTFGSGEIFGVTPDGVKQPAVKLPKGQLDGIVGLENGDLLVSSWEAKAVYRGDGKEWKPVVSDVQSPADLGYDTKRKRLLIPLFEVNGIAIRTLE